VAWFHDVAAATKCFGLSGILLMDHRKYRIQLDMHDPREVHARQQRDLDPGLRCWFFGNMRASN
jgi:hypothetical protein